MSETITLPSGNTVTFRDPKAIRQKDRKRIYENTDNRNEELKGISLIEGVIAMFVESWSFTDLSLPSFNIDVLGELELGDFDALSLKAGDLIKILFPQVNASAGTETGDDSPFNNSNA
jgi:hypothetical protein